MTETWLSTQGDEAKTAELAPSGFDVKSFPRQSRSRGVGIATVYKSTLGSSITFKTSFDFTHTSLTIHLKSLHWLPVKVRSTYKIACLCYHCHSSTAPSYVTDMLHKKPLHTGNTRSSSYTMPLLNRPAHSMATLGDRSFSFASSSVWNSIPNNVRCAPSLSSFKSRLKTYLFRSVYID